MWCNKKLENGVNSFTVSSCNSHPPLRPKNECFCFSVGTHGANCPCVLTADLGYVQKARLAWESMVH